MGQPTNVDLWCRTIVDLVDFLTFLILEFGFLMLDFYILEFWILGSWILG